MFGRLKAKWFGAPKAATASRLESLVAESQKLGLQLDELRERRAALRTAIDNEIAAQLPRDATVPGQVLDIKTER